MLCVIISMYIHKIYTYLYVQRETESGRYCLLCTLLYNLVLHIDCYGSVRHFKSFWERFALATFLLSIYYSVTGGGATHSGPLGWGRGSCPQGGQGAWEGKRGG